MSRAEKMHKSWPNENSRCRFFTIIKRNDNSCNVDICQLNEWWVYQVPREFNYKIKWISSCHQLENFKATPMFNKVLYKTPRFTRAVINKFLSWWKSVLFTKGPHISAQIFVHLGKRTCNYLDTNYAGKNSPAAA